MSDTLGHVDASSGVLESLPLAAFVVQDGRHVHCNRAAMRLFDLDGLDELGLVPFDELVHPDDRPAALARQREVLAGRTIESFVERSPGPDGRWRHLELSAAPTTWGGRPAGLYVVRDVTEQLRDEERARSLTRQLSRIVDTITVGAGLVDRDGVLRSANRALLELVGEDPVGRPLATLFDASGGITHDAPAGQVTRLVAGPRAGRWVRVTLAPLSGDVRAGSLVQVEDIDEDVRTREQLDARSLRDPITGLANRTGFAAELTTATRHGSVTVVVMDVDDFGIINESLGHGLGDDVLREIAARLRRAVRPADTVARIGGDSFAVLAPSVDDVDQALAIARRCHEALARPLAVAGEVLHLRSSAGAAVGAPDHEPERILAMADAALGRARRRGGDQVQLGSPDTADRARERLSLDAALRAALERRSIEAYLQPLWRLGDGGTVGFESLARWTHQGRSVRPDRFVPLAEELHLSRRLDLQVAERAAQLVADAIGRDRVPPETYLSVNVDPDVMCDTGAASELVSRVRVAGLPPEQLVVELTERRIPADADALRRGVEVVQAVGVRVALDDFGVGQSSLARLIDLPFDIVKLDREFIRHLGNPRGCQVVRGVIDLCRRLGVQDVVEGVETERERHTLLGLGATQAQGWLVAPALDPAALREYDPRARLRPPPVDEDGSDDGDGTQRTV